MSRYILLLLFLVFVGCKVKKNLVKIDESMHVEMIDNTVVSTIEELTDSSTHVVLDWIEEEVEYTADIIPVGEFTMSSGTFQGEATSVKIQSNHSKKIKKSDSTATYKTANTESATFKNIKETEDAQVSSKALQRESKPAFHAWIAIACLIAICIYVVFKFFL